MDRITVDGADFDLVLEVAARRGLTPREVLHDIITRAADTDADFGTLLDRTIIDYSEPLRRLAD